MKTIGKLFLIVIIPFLTGVYMPEKDANKELDYLHPLNPEYLDGPFTGGFGEQSCHSCHFDYDLNQDGGSLTIQGINDVYKPGSSYEVTVTVESEQLKIGGFQMTTRFEDGTQAGSFEWEDERLMFTPSISGDLQYLQHSSKGTSPTGKQEVSWSFIWQSPEGGQEPVIFNIAANAGNYDDSSFGDWIYVDEIIISPN